MSKFKILVISMVIAGLLLGGVISFGAPYKSIKDISIFYMVKASGSYYWQIVMTAAKMAAKNLGIKNIVFQEPSSESDVARQVSILNNAITIHPDAIILAPTVSDALVPGIIRAMKSGIKVILIDSAANTDNYVSFLTTNNFEAGKALSKVFVDLIRAKFGRVSGDIAYMTNMAGVGSLSQRDQGFLKGLKEYGPDLKVVAHEYAQDSISKAVANWSNMFTAHPDIVGAFADNEPTGDALARVIQSSGLTGKFVAVSFDSDSALISALSNGIVDGLQVQKPWNMGYSSIYYAAAAVNGVVLPKLVDTGAMVVTRANMNTPEGKAVLDPVKFYTGK